MKERNRKIFLGFILVLCPALSFSQEIKLMGFINKEHLLMEELYDGNIFNVTRQNPKPHFTIVNVDTIHLYLDTDKNENIRSVDIIKIGIKMTNVIDLYNIPVENQKKLERDTLNYYVLSTGAWSKNYRLFGFYSTDMTLFLYDYGKGTFKSLARQMKEKEITSKKETRVFVDAILNGERVFPAQLKKPCELLKYFFTEKYINKASTLILPLELLRPFRI